MGNLMRIGDVASVEQLPKNVPNGSVWLLNLDMIEKDTGRILQKDYVGPEKLGGSVVPFSAKCVLYSKLRPNLNKAVLPDEGGYATTELLPLVVNNTLMCREYLAHYLRSKQFVAYAIDAVAGAKMPRISRKAVLGAPIPVPSIADQREIALRLDKVQHNLQLQKAMLTSLDELVKSRFVEMFGNGGWPTVALQNVADVQGGLTKNKRRESLELQLPYLRVANVLQGELDLTEMLSIGLTETERKKTLLKRGDLLFVEGNGSRDQIGRSAIWDGSIDPCVHQNHLIRARLGERLLPVFALAYFSSPSGREQIVAKAVSTSGLFTLSTGKIKSLELPVPPLALQQEFAAFVQQVDKLKFETQQAIDKLHMLYDSLAQKYFATE